MKLKKWKPTYIFLFCALIFILTALGLTILYTNNPLLSFWSTLIYPIVLLIVYIFLIDPMRRELQLSRKKLLLLTFSITVLSMVITHSIWIVMTPNWSFTVTTDKSTYELGEKVQITVSLENSGFIAHSFTSSISDPIVVSISYVYPENPTIKTQVWFSPYHFNKTEFTLYPHQSLERKFVWNQTNIHNPEKGIEPGTYLIKAIIPCADSNMPIGVDNLFYTWTIVNITAT